MKIYTWYCTGVESALHVFVLPGDLIWGSFAFWMMTTWQRFVAHHWLDVGQPQLHSFLVTATWQRFEAPHYSSAESATTAHFSLRRAILESLAQEG